MSFHVKPALPSGACLGLVRTSERVEAATSVGPTCQAGPQGRRAGTSGSQFRRRHPLHTLALGKGLSLVPQCPPHARFRKVFHVKQSPPLRADPLGRRARPGTGHYLHILEPRTTLALPLQGCTRARAVPILYPADQRIREYLATLSV